MVVFPRPSESSECHRYGKATHKFVNVSTPKLHTLPHPYPTLFRPNAAFELAGINNPSLASVTRCPKQISKLVQVRSEQCSAFDLIE